ncbi:MAG: ATP-binding protein [Clostridium sp.]|jgi:anti-sigma regulatory factor (Ser/Thr protein kinase)|nr:ATP-binding protein [Clostridium sp.]
MKEMLIQAQVENLDRVLEFVETEAGELSAKERSQIAIAAEEIFVNIARYAYEGESGEATVRIVADGGITIEFEDSGTPYDPLAKEDPDVTLPAEERQIGGLGVFMVKKMMDSVDYRREGNKNIMTIRKGCS